MSNNPRKSFEDIHKEDIYHQNKTTNPNTMRKNFYISKTFKKPTSSDYSNKNQENIYQQNSPPRQISHI